MSAPLFEGNEPERAKHYFPPAGTSPVRPVHTSLMNYAVPQRQDSIAESGGKVIVRDQKNRGVEFAMKVVEEAKDIFSRGGVEIAGGLVPEQNGRAKNERAGDGHSLALTSGKFVGTMMRASLESHALQHCFGALFGFAPPRGLANAAAGRHFQAR